MSGVGRETERARPRRGRRASTDVAVVMILAALVSASLVGVLTFVMSRTLLQRAATDQVVDIGANRADLIERGLESRRGIAAVLAVEPSVSAALVDLTDAYAATDDTLDAGQVADLEALYEQGIEIATPPGVDPPSVDALFPDSDTALYLQHHYVASVPPEERSSVVDPGDGSPYSEAHARHHPGLLAITDVLGTGDVVLVDLDGVVVYSTDKRVDFATSLTDGPHADSGLASVVANLRTAAVDEVVTADYAPYVPAGGQPQLWMASVVQRDGEVVGFIATAVGEDGLVEVTTAGGAWEGLGLGDTGEVYVVGPDGLMRSESRPWLEDPDGYLQALADAGYPETTVETVETYGTTVLTQPVDTEAVTAALRGEEFEGVTTSYLDRRVQAWARPIDPGGLGWVVVAEAETDEVFAPLQQLIVRQIVIAALGVPLVVLVAFVVARRMLRPIDPIMDGVDRVADGDLDVRVAMAGHDEFTDLATQFDLFVEELRHQRDEVARADAETTDLIASVIPRRLVDEYRAGNRDISETMRNAALVAVTLSHDESEDVLSEDELAAFSSRIAAGIAELAAPRGAEQVASSAVTTVFATGLDSVDLEIDDAVSFALDARRWLDGFLAEERIPLSVGVGVAAGDVIATVVGTQRVAFDVFGTPRHTAEMLARVLDPGVLVDATIAGRIGEETRLERVGGLQDARGGPLDGWRLEDPAPIG